MEAAVVAAPKKETVVAAAAAAVVAAPKKETRGGSEYRTRLASGSRYSQNQSQGIELDVHKEKVGAETEGMDPAGVVAQPRPE